MQEEEYTFVTLDDNEAMPTDAVVIDVEGEDDFITLSDDTIMLTDTDTMDLFMTDMDGADISVLL